MDARNRVIEALERSGTSRQALADKLGLGRGAVSAKLNSEAEFDSIKYVEATAALTGYSIEWLLTGKGNRLASRPDVKHDMGSHTVYEPVTSFVPARNDAYLSGRTIRPVTVVVDRNEKELITYVPVKAQAGYLKGYEDPMYIEHLPAFSLPILKRGSYRMFEADGDSMLQMGGGGIHDGDIVIAQYVEDIFSMKDRRVYVLVTTEGVTVKRCINRLKEKENPILVCQSDNKNGQHPDFIVRPHEIIEVWELKAFISKQLGFATDIWDLLSAVETKVALMDEKIKKIEKERFGD